MLGEWVERVACGRQSHTNPLRTENRIREQEPDTMERFDLTKFTMYGICCYLNVRSFNIQCG